MNKTKVRWECRHRTGKLENYAFYTTEWGHYKTWQNAIKTKDIQIPYTMERRCPSCGSINFIRVVTAEPFEEET